MNQQAMQAHGKLRLQQLQPPPAPAVVPEHVADEGADSGAHIAALVLQKLTQAWDKVAFLKRMRLALLTIPPAAAAAPPYKTTYMQSGVMRS
jgi:hypothetical protein